MKNKQQSSQSEEDRLLISRVEDAAGAVTHTWSPRFIGFLDGHQHMVAQAAINALHSDANHVFWGGYDAAERVYLGFFPDEPDNEAFPIGALRFDWKFGTLTHRDFLGALLSLGIRRDKLGDIIISGNSCTVVAERAITDFIAQNLAKVGGSGVSCGEINLDTIVKQQEFCDLRDTIASPRLDCVVAALVNMSRTQSDRLIQSGLVQLSFETAIDSAARVSGGATVSIRGHGRFIVDSIGPETKKGRLRFAARKYL